MTVTPTNYHIEKRFTKSKRRGKRLNLLSNRNVEAFYKQTKDKVCDFFFKTGLSVTIDKSHCKKKLAYLITFYAHS